MNNPELFFKRTVKTLASVTGVRSGFPTANAGSVNIIAYHRVVADIAKAEREAIHGIVVSSNTFRKHCELLRKTFDVVSLETAQHFLDGKRKVVRPMAVITFDDGYLDNYVEAFPILNNLGLPATIFLPTDYIGKTTPLPHDRIYWLLKQAFELKLSLSGAFIKAGFSNNKAIRFSNQRDILKLTDSLAYLPNKQREKTILEIEKMLGHNFKDYPAEYQLMNWEMVREMSRKGISFGVHTSSHSVLSAENESQLEYEITGSKTKLEAELGQKVYSFAYPNGQYNNRIKEFVLESGFTIAVTTEKKINKPEADLLSLGRISLCEESTRGIVGTYSAGIASLRLGVCAI